jgi:hypothetical protein
MLQANRTSLLQRPVRVSRQRLSAVAKLAASRPADAAAPQKAADLSSLKDHSQAYIEKYAVPVAKCRQQVVSLYTSIYAFPLLKDTRSAPSPLPRADLHTDDTASGLLVIGVCSVLLLLLLLLLLLCSTLLKKKPSTSCC